MDLLAENQELNRKLDDMKKLYFQVDPAGRRSLSSDDIMTFFQPLVCVDIQIGTLPGGSHSSDGFVEFQTIADAFTAIQKNKNKLSKSSGFVLELSPFSSANLKYIYRSVGGIGRAADPNPPVVGMLAAQYPQQAIQIQQQNLGSANGNQPQQSSSSGCQQNVGTSGAKYLQYGQCPADNSAFYYGDFGSILSEQCGGQKDQYNRFPFASFESNDEGGQISRNLDETFDDLTSKMLVPEQQLEMDGGGTMHVRDFVSGDFGGSAKRPYDQAFPTHQMPAAAPPAVVSPQQPMSRIVQLERRNAELNKEVECLKERYEDMMKREKERYDALLSLFRETYGQQQRIVQTQIASGSSSSTPLRQPATIQSLDATFTAQHTKGNSSGDQCATEPGHLPVN